MAHIRKAIYWPAAVVLMIGFGKAAAGPTQPPDAALRNKLIKAMATADSFRDRFEAEVWFVDMDGRLERFVPDRKERLNLLQLIHREASRVQLSPELVLSVIEVESRFDRFAISEAGARGLMQIMPFWLQEIGRPTDNLFHTETNLRFGCTILRHYLDKENGDLTRALARYNGSSGSPRYPNLVYRAMRSNWYQP